MPRRRTSRKAKRSRRTRRQRGGAAEDPIIGKAVSDWIITLKGDWKRNELRTADFASGAWPALTIAEGQLNTSDYTFTFPGSNDTNILTVIDLVQHPGSLGKPANPDEYKTILQQMKEEGSSLKRYVTIENALRKLLEDTPTAVDDTTITAPGEFLALWYLAGAYTKEITEAETTPISSMDSSAQPSQPTG